MTALAGRTILLLLDTTGAGAYTQLAGLRSREIKINSETVDVTNSDSPNQWRELLANAGIKSMEASGSGVLLDAAVDASIISVNMNGTIRNWRLFVPGIGTFQGLFQISQYGLTGDHNGAAEFSLSIMSAGEITFTGA